MKKVKRYLAVVCLVLAVALCGMSAGAEAQPACAKKVTLQFRDGSVGGSYLVAMNSGIYLKNVSSKAKSISLKSSNKKINAVWNPGESRISLYVNGKVKNGEKSKITLKLKQNGKTYTLRCQVVLKRQINPVKTISIDGKAYKKFKKSTFGWEISTGKKLPSSVKIKVAPKAGYKIIAIEAEYYKPGWHKGEVKKIKNGSKVKTKFKGGTLENINVSYYQNSDLQGMITGKELEDLYGQNTATITVKFK